MDQPATATGTSRAQLMRRAGDLIGPERLATLLIVAPRTVYHWMAGKRDVKDSVIFDTRQILLRHLRSVNELVDDLDAES